MKNADVITFAILQSGEIKGHQNKLTYKTDTETFHWRNSAAEEYSTLARIDRDEACIFVNWSIVNSEKGLRAAFAEAVKEATKRLGVKWRLDNWEADVEDFEFDDDEAQVA